ncbi:MAG TPA: DUF6702 family protein [Bacteroidales bacterium]|nr:DUF6702 family protein [Bacteroidales bacterium]
MFRILFLIWFFVHPVHETLTSLEFVQEKSEIQGFVRIYLDDYLSDCNHHGVTIKNEEMLARTSGAKETLQKYINDKLIININKTVIPGKLKDFLITGNEVDIVFSYSIKNKPFSVSVKNNILTDLYDDQSNMMILKVGEFEEGVKFTSFFTEKTFVIK